VLRERYPERRGAIQEGNPDEAYPDVGWGFYAGKARGLLGREWIEFEKSVLDSVDGFVKLGG